MAKLEDVILEPDTRANQPAANSVAVGTLYCVTDEGDILERSDGAAWVAYSPTGSGSGTVTNTGTLTAEAVILGNGGVDVKALALGTAGKVLTMNAGATAPEWATPAVVKIEEQTPSGTGVVTFSALGAYTHLRILFTGRGTQAATATAFTMGFNGDTGANYDRQLVQGLAAAAGASESLGQTAINQIGAVAAANAAAGMAGSGEITILDYRGTTFHKQAVSTFVFQTATSSGGTNIRTSGGVWRSTAAITSIALTLLSGNYEAGTKFTLYGLT